MDLETQMLTNLIETAEDTSLEFLINLELT